VEEGIAVFQMPENAEKNPCNQLDENIHVKQRESMAVSTNALLIGAFVSIIVVAGGALTAVSGKYEWMTYGFGLFVWMTVITALVVGCFVHSHIITQYIEAQPNQKETAIVT
jgi:type IV secretory pathway TrbD component